MSADYPLGAIGMTACWLFLGGVGLAGVAIYRFLWFGKAELTVIEQWRQLLKKKAA